MCHFKVMILEKIPYSNILKIKQRLSYAMIMMLGNEKRQKEYNKVCHLLPYCCLACIPSVRVVCWLTIFIPKATINYEPLTNT
jgi:hypothetical protein